MPDDLFTRFPFVFAAVSIQGVTHCTQCCTSTLSDESRKREKSDSWNLMFRICHEDDVISINRKGSWSTRRD